MSDVLFKGDQFLGYNVNPQTGDLILRYVMVVTNKPDANGRGITSRVMETNRKSAKGRPLIYAPNKSQGGTRGHVNSLGGDDPYKFEVGRILNIERADANLWQRMKNKMVQTNSGYIDMMKQESDLWVADFLITNPEMKKILLNPVTSHLIPRHVSPSFIHKRNPSGDYSRVDDAILDHVSIVDKPSFDSRGIQIEGAAYGDITKLRGACFGDKVACLNLLQTSSNKAVNLDKCVSCPVQLLDRLTNLYKSLDMIQISQSSSGIVSTQDQTNTNTTKPNQQTQQSQTVPNQTQVTSNQQGSTFVPDQQSTTTGNPLGSFFKTDNDIQNQYQAFKNIVTQVVKENASQFKDILQVDASAPQSGTQTPTNQADTQTPQGTNTDNVQTGENQQIQTNQQVTETLQKLKITEDELRNMKTEDIKKRFGQFEDVVKQVIEEQLKTTKQLENIKSKEDKIKIATLLPKEAFTDDRGFNATKFDEVVEYLHKKKIDDQYIAVLGVGFITLRNEQNKVKEQQINLKHNRLPEGFGESIKSKLASQNNQTNQNQGGSNQGDLKQLLNTQTV